SASQSAAALARPRERPRERHAQHERAVGLVDDLRIARPVETVAGIDPEQEGAGCLEFGLANEKVFLARRPAPVDTVRAIRLCVAAVLPEIFACAGAPASGRTEMCCACGAGARGRGPEVAGKRQGLGLRLR